MRKTFCDRDDHECTSRIGHVHLSVIHQTSDRKVVGEDEYQAFDLCGDCIDELLTTFLENKMRRLSWDKFSDTERAMVNKFSDARVSEVPETDFPTGELPL